MPTLAFLQHERQTVFDRVSSLHKVSFGDKNSLPPRSPLECCRKLHPTFISSRGTSPMREYAIFVYILEKSLLFEKSSRAWLVSVHHFLFFLKASSRSAVTAKICLCSLFLFDNRCKCILIFNFYSVIYRYIFFCYYQHSIYKFLKYQTQRTVYPTSFNAHRV